MSPRRFYSSSTTTPCYTNTEPLFSPWVVSLDPQTLSRMRKNQLSCPHLPSEEFGAFPELLSCSVRILQAPLREPCEQAHVLAVGPEQPARLGISHGLRASAGAWQTFALGRYTETRRLFLCVCFLSPENLPGFWGS